MPIPNTNDLAPGTPGHIQDHIDISQVLSGHRARLSSSEGIISSHSPRLTAVENLSNTLNQQSSNNIINAHIDPDDGTTLVLTRKNGEEVRFPNMVGAPGQAGQDGSNGLDGVDGDGVIFLDAGESSAGIPDGTKICRRY